jgi:hypothetical protein
MVMRGVFFLASEEDNESHFNEQNLHDTELLKIYKVGVPHIF